MLLRFLSGQNPCSIALLGCRIQSGDRVCALSGDICPIFDVGRSHARGPIRPVNTMPGGMNYPVNDHFSVSSHSSEQRALLPFPLLRPRPPRFWPPQLHPLRISPPHHRPARTLARPTDRRADLQGGALNHFPRPALRFAGARGHQPPNGWSAIAPFQQIMRREDIDGMGFKCPPDLPQ